MVFRRGVEVSIVDLDGKPFIEYGEQRITRHTQNPNVVSTKIEAKTGRAFHIVIKPQHPFPIGKDEAGAKSEVVNPFTPANKKRANSQPVMSKAVEEDAELTGRTFRATAKRQERPVPRFQLAVYVYMDGNDKPECRSIIYLDPNDTKTWKPNGIKLTGRWESKGTKTDRTIRVSAWTFNLYGGLEYWLGKLNVNAANAVIPTSTDEFDDSEMASKLAGNNLDDKPHGKKGVIKVVIKRIKVEGPAQAVTDRDLYTRQEGEKEKMPKMSDPVNEWLTHETGVERSKGQDLNLHVMAWSKFDATEDFYAEFEFQYMARDKLVKLGLSELDGSRRRAGAGPAKGADVKTSGTKRGKQVDSDEDETLSKKPTPLFSKVRTRAQTKAEKEDALRTATSNEWRGNGEAEGSDDSDEQE